MPRPSAKPGTCQETRAFSYEELARFFNHCRPVLRPLVARLPCTAATLAELAPSPRSTHTPLLKTEVDFEPSLIHPRQAKSVPGKKAKLRPPLPVPPELLKLLEWQIEQTPRDYPLVFHASHNACANFASTPRKAGIPRNNSAGRRLWVHSFRHTYCTPLARQVPNAWMLKEILGHNRIATTEKYTHVTAEAVPIPTLNLLPPGLSDLSGKKPDSVQSPTQ